MTKAFYLNKRENIWYVRFRDGRTNVLLSAVSSGETNKTAAEKWALALALAPTMSSPAILFGLWAKPFFGKQCPHVTRLRLEGRSYSEQDRRVENGGTPAFEGVSPSCERRATPF